MEMKEDLLQEAVLARLEGRDPVQAVNEYRRKNSQGKFCGYKDSTSFYLNTVVATSRYKYPNRKGAHSLLRDQAYDENLETGCSLEESARKWVRALKPS